MFKVNSFFSLNLFILVQAAAHGLPMVATKNGGPVDIHRVNKEFPIFSCSKIKHGYQYLTMHESYLGSIQN